MKIEVTKSDIENGEYTSITRCPVALALKRKFPQTKIIVGYDSLKIGKQYYWASKQIQDFIYNLANHLPVEPFSFETEDLKARDPLSESPSQWGEA